MSKKIVIDGIVYEEVTEGNYFIYPDKGSFKDDFDKPYQIRVVKESDDSWSTGIQYDNEFVPKKLTDYVKVVKKRFKGKGKTERPICPHCQQDLIRSYEYKMNPKTGKRNYMAYGWHCDECPYEIRD